MSLNLRFCKVVALNLLLLLTYLFKSFLYLLTTFNNAYFIIQDGPESDQEAKKENKLPAQKVETKKAGMRKSTVLKSKFRSEDKVRSIIYSRLSVNILTIIFRPIMMIYSQLQDEDSEQKRKDHQAELDRQKQEEGI